MSAIFLAEENWLAKQFIAWQCTDRALNMAKIDASTKIVEILRGYPRAAEYLLELGICE